MIYQHLKLFIRCRAVRELSGLPSEIVFLGNDTYTEFKGAIAENYVLQSLVPQYDILPRYWTSIGKQKLISSFSLAVKLSLLR